MKIFKEVTITTALAAMTLAPTLVMTPASAAQPAAPAAASMSQQVSVEQAPAAELQARGGGVRMIIENHTDKRLYISDRNSFYSQWLRPGEKVTFLGDHQDGHDDLELSVHTVNGGSTGPKFLEIDGANPKIGYPNINLEHFPDRRSDFEGFSTHESKTMLDGRVWVKRNADDHRSNKQFDIHIKNAS